MTGDEKKKLDLAYFKRVTVEQFRHNLKIEGVQLDGNLQKVLEVQLESAVEVHWAMLSTIAEIEAQS